MRKAKRDKAWLGAVIGAIGSIAGGIISSNAAKAQADKQYALQKEQWEKAQIAQNKQDTINQARELTNQYSNQDYVDDLKKRITFKSGGKMKNKIDFTKRFKCGGRRKAEAGIDWNSVIGSGIDAFSNIATASINANTMDYVNSKQKNWTVESSNSAGTNAISNGKTYVKEPSYMRREDYYMCGGRKRRK